MHIPDGDHPVWRILYVLTMTLVLVVLLSGAFGNYKGMTTGDIITILGMVLAAAGGQTVLATLNKKAVEKKIEKALETETPTTKQEMEATVATILKEPLKDATN